VSGKLRCDRTCNLEARGRMPNHPTKRPRRKPTPSVPTHMERNVRAIAQLEQSAMAERSSADRLSDAITHVAGSLAFLVLHIVVFGLWIAVNIGLVPGVQPFDPYPFSFLTLVVSLEAIFLATFVLMSQNRAARLADRRAHLDLQVDLLAERELTAILHMLRALCDKQKVVLDDVGTDVNDLLEETDVKKLASNLNKKLPA
jgi:uncharacterized membrane protein